MVSAREQEKNKVKLAKIYFFFPVLFVLRRGVSIFLYAEEAFNKIRSSFPTHGRVIPYYHKNNPLSHVHNGFGLPLIHAIVACAQFFSVLFSCIIVVS